MKNALIIVILTAFIPNAFAQSYVDWNNLYNKTWRKEEVKLIKPDEEVLLYSRGQSTPFNYDSVMSSYNADGTKTGFNIDGKPFLNSWEKIDNTHILSKGDPKAAEIIKLTNTEFIVQIRQLYKSSYTDQGREIISQTKYVSFDPCSTYESLRSGNWDDPTTWTCQKVPTLNDSVQINKDHTVTVPNNYTAYAKTMSQKGKLDLKQNAKLVLE